MTKTQRNTSLKTLVARLLIAFAVNQVCGQSLQTERYT